jgi:hypothetical protein
MEPLVIPRLAMENGNGAVRVRAAFNNMTIRGGSNYTILWIKYVFTSRHRAESWSSGRDLDTLSVHFI